MTPPLSFPGGWETTGRTAAMSNDPVTAAIRLDVTEIGIDVLISQALPYRRRNRHGRVRALMISTTAVTLITTFGVWLGWT